MKTSSLATILTLAGALATLADSPLINNISVRQRWPWSKKVDISFVVGATNVPQDAVFTAYNGTTLLGVIPDAALSGDHYGLPAAGDNCSVVFDPAASGFAPGVIKDFRVEITTAESVKATNILYKIINLSNSSSYPVTDVTEADIVNGKYGSWQRNPVDGIDSVIWTAVTNADVWATTNLVLRRIPAGSYYMGYDATDGAAAPSESQHVTISKDFYIGVFEITQRQWELVRPEKASMPYFTNRLYYATRPAEGMGYIHIRGNDRNWPSDTTVNPLAFCGIMTIRTGGLFFDLPTDAQWEYACRAGTQTQLNSGEDLSESALAAIARHGLYSKFVSSTCPRDSDLSIGTMTVGSYRPNAWGLYDMFGNVYEYCRDWSGTTVPDSVNTPITTDPTGPASNADSKRLARGGWWIGGINNGKFTNRFAANSDGSVDTSTGFAYSFICGFRVMLQP